MEGQRDVTLFLSRQFCHLFLASLNYDLPSCSQQTMEDSEITCSWSFNILLDAVLPTQWGGSSTQSSFRFSNFIKITWPSCTRTIGFDTQASAAGKSLSNSAHFLAEWQETLLYRLRDTLQFYLWPRKPLPLNVNVTLVVKQSHILEVRVLKSLKRGMYLTPSHHTA